MLSIGFIQTEKTDGAQLYKLITEEMLQLGLHLWGLDLMEPGTWRALIRLKYN